MKKLYFLTLLLFSFFVNADNPVTGEVTTLSAISTSSGHLGAGYIELQINGVTLDSPCVWLWIKQEDQAIMAMLLSAQAQAKKVTVYYKKELYSPWGTGSCGVTTVQLTN